MYNHTEIQTLSSNFTQFAFGFNFILNKKFKSAQAGLFVFSQNLNQWSSYLRIVKLRINCFFDVV